MAVLFAGVRSNPNPIPAGIKPVVKGIELQAVGIEAKSVALCSPPGSQLLASLSRNLYGMIIFSKVHSRKQLESHTS